MTNEISERVSAKRRWDDARKEYAKPLSLKLSQAAAADEMMDSAIAYTATLEAEVERLQTALAAVSSERYAAVAALEPIASMSLLGQSGYLDKDHMLESYIDKATFAKQRAAEALQVARQHDDAEGDGGER